MANIFSRVTDFANLWDLSYSCDAFCANYNYDILFPRTAFITATKRLLTEGQDPTDGLMRFMHGARRIWRSWKRSFWHSVDIRDMVLMFKYAGADDIPPEYPLGTYLNNELTTVFKDAMAEFKSIIRARCATIKEELMQKVYHPDRVERFGGADWLD